MSDANPQQLTSYRLGKVKAWDAVFYATAQFLGAVGGVAIAAAVLRGALAHGAVRYAVTVPGIYGSTLAFVVEFAISFGLLSTVLFVSNREALARYTPYFAGALVAVYICFEAPLSGMSMNPARTFGSAFHAAYWHALWIYFTAPPLGMRNASCEFDAAFRPGARSCTTPTTSVASSVTDACPRTPKPRRR